MGIITIFCSWVIVTFECINQHENYSEFINTTSYWLFIFFLKIWFYLIHKGRRIKVLLWAVHTILYPILRPPTGVQGKIHA